MNRMEFMKDLEQLLSDVAIEERQEALSFYENYFEDAGDGQEARILGELGSPERIAGIIKADLNCEEPVGSRGEYTEGGFRDTAYQEDKFEMVGSTNAKVVLKKPNQQDSFELPRESIQGNPEKQGGEYSNVQSEQGQYQQGQYQQGQYQQGMGQQNNNQQQYTDDSMHRVPKKRSAGMIILMVLAILFIVIPIGIPLACAGFAIFIALFSTIFGLLVAFGATAFVMLLCGLLLVIVGIVKMFSIPWFGIVCLGAGCFLFGFGILFAILAILICTKVLPSFVRGCVAICKLLFQKRSVAA